MTKSDLIHRLTASFPELTAADVEMSVKLILGELSNTLVKKGRAEIRGFGSFTVNRRPPRNGRNPKTGESVKVPAKDVPHFRAGKELRGRVDVAKFDDEPLVLTRRESERLLELIENPPPRTEKFIRAMKDHDATVISNLDQK